MAENDPYLPVADRLVADLSAAKRDLKAEEAALQRAIDGYLAIAGGGEPFELGLAEYFADEGTQDAPPALERVPDQTEEDFDRWRTMLADLAGY